MLEIHHIKKQIENHHLSMLRLLSSREKSCFYFLKSLRISAIAKIFYAKCTKKTEFLLIYFALFGVLK